MTKQARGATKTASAQRLREALTTMVRQRGDSASPPALTATALCDLAGISRNALYRYHPDILIELHRLQHRRRRTSGPSALALEQLRADNRSLHHQVAMIAALVDHYFCAWQESQTLLERRERELAELRRHVKPKLVSIQHK